jgi:hypothetical protein
MQYSLRFLGALVLLLAGFVQTSNAASGVRFLFGQSDCAFVDHWSVLRADITPAKPNPQVTDAVVYATIPNQPPSACGPTVQAAVLIPLVGNTRWWLRAVTATNFTSPESPEVDRVIPLAAPTVVDVTAVP